MSDTIDPEAVLDACIDGLTLPEIRRRFKLTESKVKAILDEATKAYFDPVVVRQRWMIAEKRMERIETQFFKLAKEKDDHIAGALAVKANERRSTLSGANSPIGHIVQLTNAAPLVQETSTEFYSRVLDRLMGKEPEPEPQPN